MSEIATDIIQVGKEFYINERDRFYSNWIESFWREMFQNSCDAGSKTIRITLEERPRRGSFFREIEDDREIVRVVFHDDGCGMDATTIDNVFFKPGNTTKSNNNSVGGFGRARLMTHLANFRHSMITNGNVVEGDGPERRREGSEEFLGLLRGRRDAFLGYAKDAATVNVDYIRQGRIKRTISEIDENIALIEADVASPSKGCRMEIDLDPFEESRNGYRPTLDAMRKALLAYMAMSNVPAKVTLNGELLTDRLTLRGLPKKALTLASEEDNPFANAYHTRSKNADFLRTMLVRVDGATMFTTWIDTDAQIILEIDKKRSREILTSNRDGFTSDYKRRVDAFVQELVVDTMSALDARKDDFQIVEGEAGNRFLSKPRAETVQRGEILDRGIDLSDEDLAPVPALSKLEKDGYEGVPFYTLHGFLDDLKHNGWSSFLHDMKGGEEALEQIQKIMWGDQHRSRKVESVLKDVDPSIVKMITFLLLEQKQKAEAERQARFDAKLKHGLPNVAVHVKGDLKGALKQAYNRHHPKKWDPATGAGRKPRQIFEAWTICCDIALKTLYENNPEVAPDQFSWTSGFVYNAPSEEYQLNRHLIEHMIEAEYSPKNDKVDTTSFLLNPVDSDGKLKFSVNKPSDLQRMAVLACHEAAHVHVNYHNEEFASLMTNILSSFDFAEMNARVTRMKKEISILYAKPKVVVQKLDDQNGVRPADRLIAGHAPRATMISGLRSEEGRENLDALYDGAFERVSQTAVVIDLHRLGVTEAVTREGLRRAEEAPVVEDEMEEDRSLAFG